MDMNLVPNYMVYVIKFVEKENIFIMMKIMKENAQIFVLMIFHIILKVKMKIIIVLNALVIARLKINF